MTSTESKRAAYAARVSHPAVDALQTAPEACIVKHLQIIRSLKLVSIYVDVRVPFKRALPSPRAAPELMCEIDAMLHVSRIPRSPAALRSSGAALNLKS
jgi:hypothetical protein